MPVSVLVAYCDKLFKNNWILKLRGGIYFDFFQTQFFQVEKVGPSKNIVLCRSRPFLFFPLISNLVHPSSFCSCCTLLTPIIWNLQNVNFRKCINSLLKPFLNTAPKQFSRGYPMSDSDPQKYNCLDGTLFCSVFCGVKKTQNLFIDLSLGKAVTCEVLTCP